MSKTPTPFSETVPDTAPREELGQMVGPYKLLQQIGEGGWGVVYLAEQEKPVRRRVALKVIKLGMDTRQVVARFEAERQALALMDHPNIARVLDAGSTTSGRPFFVMELVKGIPITHYCDQNNLSVEDRLKLLIQVCHAVQHAHHKGVIHRDLKPSNILVKNQDGVPVPKVIDFGIAKATVGQTLTDKTLFTAAEQFIGTPAYMSPEQAEMSALDIDTRTDIYSLGVLLYEVLTGKTPFDAHYFKDAGLDEIRRTIREEEPLRPSTRLASLQASERTSIAKRRRVAVPGLVHLMRGDLDWIVMKCLEKDRNRRYVMASELAKDLLLHLENEPVSARPPSLNYRLQKLVQKHRLGFAAGAVCAGLFLAGGVFSSWQAVRATRAEREGRQRLVEAESARQKSGAAERTAREEASRAATAAAGIERAMARSDFLQATHSIGEGRDLEAVASLVRCLRLSPSNQPAALRLATLLMYRSWCLPAAEPFRHDGAVLAARFSPDAKRIVTGSADKTARIWDAQTGNPAIKPLQHGGPVFAIDFSPDGKIILTGSDDGTARLWDAQTGRLLFELKHPEFGNSSAMAEAGGKSAQFSPDGRRVITASRGLARVWAVESGQPVSDPLASFYKTPPVQISADGGLAATGSEEGFLQVWDAQKGTRLQRWLGHRGEVLSLAFSPDGSRIVTGSRDKTARVWDSKTGEAATELLRHPKSVVSARFSPNGRWVVTASADGGARLWDAGTGHLLAEPMQLRAGLRSAEFSPDARQLITAADDGTARVWNIRLNRALIEPFQQGDNAPAADFSPDGKWVVTGAEDGTARVLEVQTGQPATPPLKHASLIASVQFSSAGDRVATASWDKTARVWDARNGQPVTPPLEHADKVLSARFSPDGKRIVTGSSDRSMRVWDAQTGQLTAGPLVNTGPVSSVEFSPDGRSVLGTSAQLWNAETGQLLATVPPGPRSTFWSARFSPDGKSLVTASWDGTARVWDAGTAEPRTSPLKHVADAYSAQFSPDGKRIVTASWDHTARLWAAETGQPLTEPLFHQGKVLSAQFSPDGNLITTVSDDGAVHLWDSQTGDPMAEPILVKGALSAQFSPDGRRILIASYSSPARVMEVGPTFAPCPAWMLTLAEALCGRSWNLDGNLQEVEGARLLNSVRQSVVMESRDRDWAVWGRWFLDDSPDRTISPLSRVSVPQWIENRLRDSDPGGLAEAAQVASVAGNEALFKRVEAALVQWRRSLSEKPR